MKKKLNNNLNIYSSCFLRARKYLFILFSTKINLFNTLVDGKQVNTVIRDTCNKNKKFYQYDLTKNLFR